MTHRILRLTSTRCAEACIAAARGLRRLRHTLACAAGFALVASLAGAHQPAPAPATPQSRATAPASAAPQDDGQWVMPAKNYAATRYSSLDQINGDTVKNLSVYLTFSTGVNKGHEAAPLVVNDTMYIVAPYLNYVYALDLTKPGAPLKWSYKPHPEAASQGVACCDVVNRGAAFWDGKLFFNTLDNHTIALNADTGQELWKTKLDDINLGSSMTMAPLVVKGKVL